MDEKRKAQRRRVLKDGKIVFADGKCLLDCTIRDVSDTGARLLIATTVGVPERFHLYQKSSGLPRTGRVAASRCPRRPVPGPTREHQRRYGQRYARLKFI